MLVPPQPALAPPLDPAFCPVALARRHFVKLAAESGGPGLELALLREGQKVTRHAMTLLPDEHPHASSNLPYALGVLKFLLWQRGAHRVLASGPPGVVDELSRAYSATGARAFDARLMARIYRVEEFRVEARAPHELPPEHDPGIALGEAATGCRIGFDAGGSDRKVAAVIDGRVVYSSEVVWHPKRESDPRYHIEGVRDSLMQAAERLPRVDALGVSSAGIYVENQTRVASLFRKVPEAAFEAHIRDIYIDLAKELGVPVTVANDGDVAALAGAQSLGVRPVLGLALGTSLAAGYVDQAGKIKGWLNELAFVPIASGPAAVVDDEWSGDRGVGSSYLSQEGAIRLAARAGLPLDPAQPPAERLRQVQARMDQGDPRMQQVFESLGIYLGYALLDYAGFYPLEHVLLLGRVTSGPGGALLLDAARRVLAREDAHLAGSLHLHLPSEDERRLGQSVAAASLPRVSSRG